MSLWGHLAERYETEDRPRALLALDGGGIRGAMTLEVLAEIERQLAEITGRGRKFRLADFFDYVAGTSTGAIIAAGIARGMSIAELLDFYTKAGPMMFQKKWLLARVRSFYTADPLVDKLREVFGKDTTLRPDHLKTLLLVVTRNATTDSPWPISTNPDAYYNNPERGDCNLNIPLWKLVRASTAAPIFFPPEIVEWDEKDPEKTFVFVDGGVTPYNDPAFLLFRMATAPQYKLAWKTGERNMMLVSVGTGSAPTMDGDILNPGKNLAANLAGLPGVLMNGAQVDQDVNCRLIGRCVYGASIDRELGDMIPRRGSRKIPLDEDLGRAFLYARYDAELTEKGLRSLGCGGIDPAKVRKLDAVSSIGDLRKVGKAVAKEVDVEAQFGPFLEERRKRVKG